ncbi:unnamed protein product [Adineta ricciae]|uniref:Uncharacterized protein n=1 Tax=Adineta ricciae TaxID=249248 RepID=A0A815XTM5_ADIRI|nr:unnamed protein product [Adineta ricciae]
MIFLIKVSIILFNVLYVNSSIYLHNTNDDIDVEAYDCVLLYSLFYCRRPTQPINLTRDNDKIACERNGGRLYRFSEIMLKNISISTILHQWKSSLERVEQYLHYLENSSEPDAYLCECYSSSTFGKNCEYELPIGKSFPEALDRQLEIRNRNRLRMQMYGDIICYETLRCDSGALCLDWRDICDGIQQCMFGFDEENCDLLEMNSCENDEYRCENGMCIPEEFFLDGEFDCLDWSDEMQFKKSTTCSEERANIKCDDHICRQTQWSCGDGECISDRSDFQKPGFPSTCLSGRDQYFMCETHKTVQLWTMSNGRCSTGGHESYEGLLTMNASIEKQCEFLLKCALSQGKDNSCVCFKSTECEKNIEQICSPIIPYPNKSIIAPFLFFFYNRTRNWQSKLPDFILINGTIRCHDTFVTVIKTIPFATDFNSRQIIQIHFCQPLRNVSWLQNVQPKRICHRANDSTDRCEEWNSCMSKSRINDGWLNCLNKQDEIVQTKIEIENSCSQVRRHRFHCSIEQPTCLSVSNLGDSNADCRNKFDQLWFGEDREISSISCNNEKQDECLFLRRYIDQGEDENLFDCQQFWICPERQRRCGTGQCILQSWLSDGDWDCTDVSDEYNRLKRITERVFRAAARHNFTNRSYFVPSTCNQTHPFMCLSAQSIQQGFSCINFSQIGDGRIDCAGAFDEQTTPQHCVQSSVLGPNFLCPSTHTCIPYYLHCSVDNRCPNQSDDELWCSRQYGSSNCSSPNSFTCFNGQCLKRGRCNLQIDCLFGEDEYMCDYSSSFQLTRVSRREMKQMTRRMMKYTVRWSPYPTNANTTNLLLSSIFTNYSLQNSSSTSLFLSPYWCNRGLSVFSVETHSIVCFCPPFYYGDKCEYHADRLSILLQLNFSESTRLFKEDPNFVFKVFVLFLSNNQILMRSEFSFQSISQSMFIHNDKMLTHFLYSRSFLSIDERRKRFFNRSNLLHDHPYSIRIELYRISIDKLPLLIAIWKYPILFDYLPVFRFSKILHFDTNFDERNPCSSQPCHSNEQCYPLMNNKSHYICLCRSNFTGENCSEENQHCLTGYCSRGSLCQPNSLILSDKKRFSLPFCLCSLNRFGERCTIKHDQCHFNPCLNNGSCISQSQPDQIICLCTRQYRGPLCQWKRPSMHLSLLNNISHSGVVIQFLQIDLTFLQLTLVDQQVFKILPSLIEYFQYDDQKAVLPDIVLTKIYLDVDDFYSSDVYLLSLYRNLNLFSLHAKTEISPDNRCDHIRTFSNDSSPIRYHQLCIQHPNRICFRDDVYLCICTDNHSQVECFLYDNELDQCSHCLSNSHCLRGDPYQRTDFICLCPPCSSGQQCQFNTKSFSFTLDQLFYFDFLSDNKQRTISLLIVFSFLLLFVSFPNNFFSYVTLRHPSCQRHGVGHYLLWMSIINQVTLIILIIRLLHLIIGITLSGSSSPLINDLLCKLFNYLLICFTRLSSWLSSFVAIERIYTTIFFNKNCFKQPHIARFLIFGSIVFTFLSSAYELIFVKSFTTFEDSHKTICVIEFPTINRSTWIFIHQFVSISNIVLPLLINLCSTLTIMSIVTKNKMNIQMITNLNNNEIRDRKTVLQSVLIENREMIARPAITLVPSIFSLFSLPLFIISLSLGCQNLEYNSIRYILILFYFLTFIPQMMMFYIYIYPSSFYWKQWHSSKINQQIIALRTKLCSNNQKEKTPR